MLSKLFASHVFTREVMKNLLPAEILTRIDSGEPPDTHTADVLAGAMKDWAISLGATHYCHWFQPLTGATAEKHMSFFSPKGLLQLTGRQLQLGESDASSFPTGGLRQTAYARGYTAWDRTAPVFVRESAAGRVLCIPTVFISSSGEALDLKTPLMRSMDALNTQALRLLGLLGNQRARRVIPMVGAEQEYFLIDRKKFSARRDLVLCGRTLFGAPPPKGQELDEWYCGSISGRAGAFLQEVDRLLWRLGIPTAAQHNEVAPAQLELAPHYAPAHVAADRDQLIMDTLQTVARRHGLQCLLHEKPFAHINGSGKHNNWSLETDLGENLLEPGPVPEENLQFRLILACLVRAVDLHAPLLRLSAGSFGNDRRLGGQEAPPAIVSLFLGARLEAMVDTLLSGGQRPKMPELLDSGTAAVARLKTDGDDRNRTAPLAFTGNKLELRMVGASDSIAMANIILNTAAAESFCRAADLLQRASDVPAAAEALVRRWLRRHRRIIYSGDCYSPQWPREAARRGLSSLPSLADGIPALTSPASLSLFGAFGVFSRAELESRARVLEDTCAKRTALEARTMLAMARQEIFPAVLSWLHSLTGDTPVEKSRKAVLIKGLQDLESACLSLEERVRTAEARGSAQAWAKQVVPAMDALRRTADGLEAVMPKNLWPFPTYGDLLFDP